VPVANKSQALEKQNQMKEITNLQGRFGILGGGQLGKMLCQAASSWHVDTFLMESTIKCPAAFIPHHFVEGDITKMEDVVDFGKHLDFLTIEIENVSIEGLKALEEKGVNVYPTAKTLNLIKDKAIQNDFYEEQEIASPPYKKYEDIASIREAISNAEIAFPFVQKLRTDGYDGRGVQIIRSKEDLNKLLTGKSIVEEAIDIKKELAMVVARSKKGEIKTYDPVEMVFHPEANLVEFLQSPAEISQSITKEMVSISEKIISALGHSGILAIEFFLDNEEKLWVNEMAPRPHNSGHHTIEACSCSQYEQLIRAILNLPLGDTELNKAAVMINLLGEEGYQGVPVIEGLEEVMQTPGAHLHWYGKKQTRPHRKMGHITCTADKLEEARKKANRLRQIVKVKS